MSLLVVTAVEAEREAVIRDLAPAAAAQLEVVVAGVGPVAAAIGTAAAVRRFPGASLVISAGIAGGFSGRAAVGDIAVADRITFADLGARTDAGFLTLAEMGLRQESSYSDIDARVHERIAQAPVSVVRGEILTLACMTGTDDDAAQLAARHPRAIAEAMEGFGVAAAAHDSGLPFAEIRAVSNTIGKRDPTTWNIPGAFDALAQAFAVLLKEPLE